MKLGDATHDWGYRVFGSTSSAGGNCDCTCSTIYVNIAMHVKAIEETEMIDVTPCTDANGAWAPSAECRGFQSKPQDATGTYPVCSVAPTLDPIETCGSATGLPAAGSGGLVAAGAGAPAAAGGGATSSAGRAGLPPAGGAALPIAGAGVFAGSSAVPGVGPGAIAAIGGSLGLAGAGSPQAGIPGATASTSLGNAGRPTGTLSNAVGLAGSLAAGASASVPATNVTEPPPAKRSGCQVLAAGAYGNTSPAWLGSLTLLGLCWRRLRLRRAWMQDVYRVFRA
jgi:hypothetical protein